MPAVEGIERSHVSCVTTGARYVRDTSSTIGYLVGTRAIEVGFSIPLGKIG